MNKSDTNRFGWLLDSLYAAVIENHRWQKIISRLVVATTPRVTKLHLKEMLTFNAH